MSNLTLHTLGASLLDADIDGQVTHGLDPARSSWASMHPSKEKTKLAPQEKQGLIPSPKAEKPYEFSLSGALNEHLSEAMNAPGGLREQGTVCEHTEQREAYAIAEQVVRETVRNLLPTSAMLYVPADEMATVHAKLTQVAHAMVDDAQKSAKLHGSQTPFCRQTLTKDIKQRLKVRIGSNADPEVKHLTHRHNPQFHYAGTMNEYAPETGIHTVAHIHSEYGGIGPLHGLLHCLHH